MNDEEQALWAAKVDAARQRADVAMRALFAMRSKLAEAAEAWGQTSGGFPMKQSLQILADDCNRAWHAAIEANGGPGDALPSRWPWGEHHTELLGHLDAAARKFWTLYEPDDPGTAPTNEMVSDWLQNERGVSQDKARVIASILRADRLPTGPRK